MAQIDWVTVGGFLAVLTFMWRIQRDIHKDIADLRERMARLEGRVETLTDVVTRQNTISRMKRGSHDE